MSLITEKWFWITLIYWNCMIFWVYRRRRIRVSMPFDYVHDINISYGWILFPWFGYWFGIKRSQKPRMYSKGNGFQFRKFKSFHNCTRSRIF